MKRKTSAIGARRHSAPATLPATAPPAIKKTRSSATFPMVTVNEIEELQPCRPFRREICLQITGPILSNFPELMQPQCSPEIREQVFPYFEEVSVTAPTTTGCNAHLVGMAASALENWIGLGPQSFFCYEEIVKSLIQTSAEHKRS